LKKEINLHFNSINRGPGRVIENLARGLGSHGWSVCGNYPITEGVYQACLQATQAVESLPRNTIMGPNLFVFPSEWSDYCFKFDHYIVPSTWVKNKYSAYREMSRSTIDVWAVGIDTETWQNQNNDEKKNVLVYFKSREKSELDQVTSQLDRQGISYQVIEYGSYEEKDLYNVCNSSKSCILLTGTESQGIAYMQILSMGVPCYVINKSKFDYFHYKDSPIKATSVPYFNDMCGVVRDQFDIEDFLEFLENYEKFNPRDYILEDYTLEKSAKKYIDLLLKYN